MSSDFIEYIKFAVRCMSVIGVIIIDIWVGRAVVRNWKNVWKINDNYIGKYLSVWWITINGLIIIGLIIWAWS